MIVYAECRLSSGGHSRWRVWAPHELAFHGVTTYSDELTGPRVVDGRPRWRAPALTNANREPAHVARSGTFVPAVFGRRVTELIVSEMVKSKLSVLNEIEFNPVVFERLVDLPMPKYGDRTWFGATDHVPTPEEELHSRPDIIALHDKVGVYYSLIVPAIGDVRDQVSDLQELKPNFGSYSYPRYLHNGEISLSRELMEKYPIVRGGGFLFREDSFALIAPFLDLDFYGIAVINLDPRKPMTQGQRTLTRL